MNKLPKINKNQPIAIDLETCDPELKTTAPGYISKVGFVAGIAVAAQEGSFYIPIGHSRGYNYPREDVILWLNNLLSADTVKIFHNAQYDLGWLKYIGVQVYGKIFDTMLAAALLNENRRTYSLDAIGKIYLDEGKNEVALEAAIKALFANRKTEKKIIRLIEDNEQELNYLPFLQAKYRTTQLYDLWPSEVQEKYKVIGHVESKNGQTSYKVPLRTQANIKELLWAVDAEEMGSYPIQDVDLTYRLYKCFLPLLEKENLLAVCELENEILPCLLEMREQGVKIDLTKAVTLDKQYTKELDKCQIALNKIAGFDVNVDAESDLVEVCNRLKLVYSYTSKGSPCFDSRNMPKHEVFDYVQKIRKLNKARNTYVRGYFFASSINGRLHGQYNQLKSDEGGTVTGRLSSSNPNLQNIPARGEVGHAMREIFIPDAPDEDWLCMDFSGQEPKMLVNLVLLLDELLGKRQVKNMVTGEIEIVHEEGFPGANLARQPEFAGREADFHTAVATRCMESENKHKGITVTPEELKQQAKEFRTKAKSIGLGIMYGSGDAKIAEEMTAKGAPMTKEEAKELRASVYAGVPFLSAINKYVMDLAKRRGYVLTLLKRRGRFDTWEIPIWDVERGSVPTPYFETQSEATKWLNSEESQKFAEQYKCSFGRPQRAFTYKALNKIIQGSSADQTKMAMLRLYKRNNLDINALDIYYRRTDFDPPKFRTQVHDELNFSIKQDEDIKWYQNLMENSIQLKVESVAEPGIGKCWAEAK